MSQVPQVNFCFAHFPLDAGIVRRPALYELRQAQIAVSCWPSVLAHSTYSPSQNGDLWRQHTCMYHFDL